MGAARLLERLGLRAGKPLILASTHDAGSTAAWRVRHHHALRSVARSRGGVLVFLGLFPGRGRGPRVAVASTARGAFFAGEVGPEPASLAAFVADFERRLGRPLVCAYDDAAAWRDALRAAGRDHGAAHLGGEAARRRAL
jgi:hypothetical protein